MRWNAIYLLFFLLILISACNNIDMESRKELNLGIKFLLNNNDKNAIEHFNKAIEIKPDFAEAFQYRSKVYFAANEKQLAMQDINKAIDLNPNYGEAYKSRAYYKESAGDRDGACLDYKKAKELGVHNLDNYLKNCP